jgi:protein-S-isoprenylcysteine O-methyltransferase Ste14
MSWQQVVILAVWLVVFAGWVEGVLHQRLARVRAKTLAEVDLRWKCRGFGASCAAILPLVVFVPGHIDLYTVLEIISWPAWVVFFTGAGVYYWARLVLRQSWSSEAQITERTRLTTTGPYAIVRHPIYAAKTTMALCSAVLLADWTLAVLAGVLLATSIYQARIEDRLLAANFPEHALYAQRVSQFAPAPRFLRPGTPA